MSPRIGRLWVWRDVTRTRQEAQELERRVAERTAELSRFGFGGTPAQVIDRIGQYRDAGVDTVYLQMVDLRDLDHVRLFAAEVMPAFR